MSDLFFTSDEHYGHNNIIKFCNRPFASMEEMVEGLIERHNKKVPRYARVIHAGDMFWRTFGVENAIRVVRRLNGQQLYVPGNHEELMDSSGELRSQFVSVREIMEIKYQKLPKIVAFHYPMRAWNGSNRGSWHLYGHEHGTLKENDSLSFDIGVDCWNYAPVSIDEIAAKMLPKMEKMSALDRLKNLTKRV